MFSERSLIRKLINPLTTVQITKKSNKKLTDFGYNYILQMFFILYVAAIIRHSETAKFNHLELSETGLNTNCIYMLIDYWLFWNNLSIQASFLLVNVYFNRMLFPSHPPKVLIIYRLPDQQFVGLSGNWIEIAYGTSAGTVRIIVQHPETLGQGPQLFQTFTVHCSPVTRVMISEKHLVSGKP